MDDINKQDDVQPEFQSQLSPEGIFPTEPLVAEEDVHKLPDSGDIPAEFSEGGGVVDSLSDGFEQLGSLSSDLTAAAYSNPGFDDGDVSDLLGENLSGAEDLGLVPSQVSPLEGVELSDQGFGNTGLQKDDSQDLDAVMSQQVSGSDAFDPLAPLQPSPPPMQSENLMPADNLEPSRVPEPVEEPSLEPSLIHETAQDMYLGITNPGTQDILSSSPDDITNLIDKTVDAQIEVANSGMDNTIDQTSDLTDQTVNMTMDATDSAIDGIETGIGQTDMTKSLQQTMDTIMDPTVDTTISQPTDLPDFMGGDVPDAMVQSLSRPKEPTPPRDPSPPPSPPSSSQGAFEKSLLSDIDTTGSQSYTDEESIVPQLRSEKSTGKKLVSSPKGDGSKCSWLAGESINPKMVDLVYWRDVKKSGVVFSGGLVVLLLVACCSLLQLAAYTSLTVLTVTLTFRIYKNVLQALHKSTDAHPFRALLEADISLPADRVHNLADLFMAHANLVLDHLRKLFLVLNLAQSVKFGVIMWVMTYVGSWFDGYTLLILAYVTAFTWPKIYETNKTQIDQYWELVTSKVSEVMEQVKAKIPLFKKKQQ